MCKKVLLQFVSAVILFILLILNHFFLRKADFFSSKMKFLTPVTLEDGFDNLCSDLVDVLMRFSSLYATFL